jgi:hypothetical protein
MNLYAQDGAAGSNSDDLFAEFVLNFGSMTQRSPLQPFQAPVTKIARAVNWYHEQIE